MHVSPELNSPPVIDIDPFDAEVLQDPYAFHEVIREAGPVVWLSVHGTYGSGRFDTLTSVWMNAEEFRSSPGAGLSDIRKPGAWRVPGPIVEVEPPLHTQVRKVMSQIISPRVIQNWKESFTAAAEQLCDKLLAGPDEIDGVRDVAEAYVLTVFPNALGMEIDRDNLIVVGNHNFNSIGPQNDLFKRSQAQLEHISDWYERSQQRSSLIPGGFGELIFEAEKSGQLPPGTASPMLRTLLRGGMDTTISGIETTLRYSAQRPEIWAAMQADSSAILNAFEESIRLESPSQTLFRTTAPHEVQLDGYTLRPDTKFQIFPGAANRDPRKWNNPGVFDLNRRPRAHLAFGTGIHNCLGRRIAQMEAQCVIGALAARVSRLELAGEPVLRPNNALRTLEKLPLRLVRK